MQKESLLTVDERLELKSIFMELWLRKTAPMPDLWFEAVTTFLTVCENRLNVSNNAANNSKNK